MKALTRLVVAADWKQAVKEESKKIITYISTLGFVPGKLANGADTYKLKNGVVNKTLAKTLAIYFQKQGWKFKKKGDAAHWSLNLGEVAVGIEYQIGKAFLYGVPLIK